MPPIARQSARFGFHPQETSTTSTYLEIADRSSWRSIVDAHAATDPSPECEVRVPPSGDQHDLHLPGRRGPALAVAERRGDVGTRSAKDVRELATAIDSGHEDGVVTGRSPETFPACP